MDSQSRNILTDALLISKKRYELLLGGEKIQMNSYDKYKNNGVNVIKVAVGLYVFE